MISESGRFTVEDELEFKWPRGVYIVSDKRDGESKVLKIINEAEAEKKARNEWQIWRRVKEQGRSDHIVRIYEQPLLLGTGWGILMERGKTSLHHQIGYWKQGQQQLSSDDVLDVVGQIADGLIAAHSIVQSHRDLKPANVILFEGIDSVVAKIGDFENSSMDSMVTSTQKGTPSYMAPESYMRPKTVCKYDRRSDVYSLAVILAQLAHPAFDIPFFGIDGEDFFKVINDDKQEMLRLYLDRSNMESQFAQVVLRAMHPDADKRYQSVDEFMAALQGQRVSRIANYQSTLDEYTRVHQTLIGRLSDEKLHQGPYGTAQWRNAGEIVELYRTVFLPLEQQLHAMELGGQIQKVEGMVAQVRQTIEEQAGEDLATACKVLDAPEKDLKKAKEMFRHLYCLNFSWGPPLSVVDSTRQKEGRLGREWYKPGYIDDKTFLEAIDPDVAKWMGL